MGSSSTTRTLFGKGDEGSGISSSSASSSSVLGNGSLTVNVLPLPGVLATSMLPSRARTSPSVIESPKPKPSELTSTAARSNGRNTRLSVSSSIPMPVSPTSTVSVPAVYADLRLTAPAFVNFIALVSRLLSIRSILSGSPFTMTSVPVEHASKAKALSLALRENSSVTSDRKRDRQNGTSTRVSLASFIL